MTDEKLSSNVVNYLVWRYLQEAGYAKAARGLSQSWTEEPEKLPFAKNVAPRALINMLQDGLWFDKLQAEVSQSPRRYHFGREHGRPYSIRDGADLTLEDPEATQQMTRRDIQEANGNVVEITAPKRGAKGKGRRTKVNGVVEIRPEPLANGDTMDVDQNGTTQPSHSVRGESEAVMSEAESLTVTEIPISTLSIGANAETQMEKIVDLGPNTTFVRIKDPAQTLTHTLWGQSDAPGILMTAGESLLRLHNIPQDVSGSQGLQTMDLKLPSSDYTVTAICWDSNMEAILAAREEKVGDEGGSLELNNIFKVIPGADVQAISSATAPITTILWNESSKALLATDVSGNIKVWNELDTEPMSAFTDRPILDAAWMTDKSFIVCGDDLLRVYEMDGELKMQKGFKNSWSRVENVKYDAASGSIACAVYEMNVLGLGQKDSDELQRHNYPDPYLTDFAFQPQSKSAPRSSSLLATCSAEGPIRLWDVDDKFECIRRLNGEEESPTHKLAFSPDGTALAAAGPDTVTIWDMEDGEFPMAPAAMWKAKDSTDDWNTSLEGEIALNWDSEGKRVALSVGNQVAIISVPR